MTEDRTQYRLTELVLLAMQGDISPEQFRELETLLKTKPKAIKQYVQLLELQMELSPQGSVDIPNTLRDEDSYDDMLRLLANEEKSAPIVHVEKPVQLTPEKICPVQHEPGFNGFKKRSLITVIVSIAAMLMLILFARLAPVNTGMEVATLSDSIDAEWLNTSIKHGSRMAASSDFQFLRKGFIEILFDNQTRVTIEAPAEFRILTSDQIMLNLGRVYAQVPPGAYGFTVCTASSKFIDLGTEFGIQVSNLETQLHVVKGKVNILSGFKGSRINREISNCSAQSISAVSGDIKDVPYNSQLFVRKINSSNGVVWRGQDRIDLADVVGGGNGLGTGVKGSVIDPTTGKWYAKTQLEESYISPQKTDVPYLESELRMVDGIFVPDANRGPVVVSSNGHIFKEAPATSGQFWSGVINVQKIIDKPIYLNNVLLGSDQNSALFMHSNIGITFDLDEIRTILKDKSVVKFTSSYGISESFPYFAVPRADFWVLVDGELRFSKKDVTVNQEGEIVIPLTSKDRFLTLITTEGEERSEVKKNTFNDWCIFARPALVLE